MIVVCWTVKMIEWLFTAKDLCWSRTTYPGAHVMFYCFMFNRHVFVVEFRVNDVNRIVLDTVESCYLELV